MKSDIITAPGQTLWGIFYTDREYAREQGDPLRTVIEAPTKRAAEEQAARLGFDDVWAHPVTPDEARSAQWLPTRRSCHRRKLVRKISRGIRV